MTTSLTFETPDAESLVDPRIRGLVEQYAALTGATLRQIEPHLLEMSVATGEAQHFRGRQNVRVAFSLAALERHSEAEMAVVGSAFLQELLEAIRTKGTVHRHGLLAPSFSADGSAARLDTPVRRVVAGPAAVSQAIHPLGRLIARVAIKSGGMVTEHIVESGVFDLGVGAKVPQDVAELCAALVRGDSAPVPENGGAVAPRIAPRPPDEIIRLMLGDLEASLAPEIDRHRVDAQRSLATELARIDRYYANLVEETADSTGRIPANARRAIEAEHARRRAEEERRHEVRATVHPLQLVEFGVLTQRAEWVLTTPSGHQGTFVARRVLSGSGQWQMTCPTCGAVPTELAVCRHDHVACAACGTPCSVCGDDFCRQHGLAACHVDQKPACEAHARTCSTCRRPYCTGHEATCSEGGHFACVGCVGTCGVCGRSVCATHSFQSDITAPMGGRRLCRDCMVYCEGGTNEPVGKDEVTRCASCEKYVCANHQAVCAIDKRVHCSKHLRRTDGSRRLACETHRAQCEHEPLVIFASDEVSPCATCGSLNCMDHSGICQGDEQRHCHTHLTRLFDTPAAFGCEKHRSVCHIDKRAYTATGTSSCPVCAEAVCAEHQRECKWCGRDVCRTHFDRQGLCSTCRNLTPATDPSDALITAGIAANRGEPAQAKSWRTSRDAAHTVVELDLGWTRRLIFSVRHGDTVPQHVVRRSLFGASKQL
jgi:hypothetical protein